MAANGTTKVLPDEASADPKAAIAARLLQTSANPLDTPTSTIRPGKDSIKQSAIAEEGVANGTSAYVDTEKFLSAQGVAMRESGITGLITQFAGVKDVVQLHGGLPPAAAFPIAGVSLRLADGSTVDIDKPDLVGAAQQYNTSASGYGPLRQWADDHVWRMHSPPSPHDVVITTGSNHATDLIMQLVLNRGDTFLVEGFAYSHLLEGVSEPHGYRPLPVPIDQDGIIPSGLRQVLEDRRRSHPEASDQPRVLFTVPVGHNPTGAVLPLQRKREIYAIACEFDLLLLEDDPYYVLQFRNGEVPGLQNLGRSFLSLDTQGRVIRFESASKFLAPGFRIGWAALPPPLARKLEKALFASCLGATPFSQVMLSELLSHWGDAGLEAHVKQTQQEYWRRASALHEACCQELAGLAEWQPPQAGMFLWLRLLWPPANEQQLVEKMREHRVAVVPGRISHVQGRDPNFQCPYLRIAWSYCEFEDLHEGMRRLGAALRDCTPK